MKIRQYVALLLGGDLHRVRWHLDQAHRALDQELADVALGHLDTALQILTGDQ